MRFNRRYTLIVFCLVMGGLLAPGSHAHAQPKSDLKLDDQKIFWTDLSFRAKKFWVEVSSDIRLRTVAASELKAVLLNPPHGDPIHPQSPKVAQLTIHTTIDPRFRSAVNIENQIWFDPLDASALGRIRMRRGEDDFKKAYRFTEQGVYRHRIEPQNKNQARLAPEQWTDTKDSFYAYNPKKQRCSLISERSVLIYILNAMAVANDSAPFTFCAFGKRQLHRVQIRNQGLQPIKVKYSEKGPSGEQRIEGTVKALKFAISGTSLLEERGEAENFSFLGLHRDIVVFIEPTSGLPLQISGIIPSMGKAELKLNRVELNRTSD